MTPDLVAAALSFGSLATEYVRQPHMVEAFAAWLSAEGAHGVAFTPEDLDPRLLESYDVMLTELAYQHGKRLKR
jgi:hypothetical protein